MEHLLSTGCLDKIDLLLNLAVSGWCTGKTINEQTGKQGNFKW